MFRVRNLDFRIRRCTCVHVIGQDTFTLSLNLILGNLWQTVFLFCLFVRIGQTSGHCMLRPVSFLCVSPVFHSTDAAYWYFMHLPLDILLSLPLWVSLNKTSHSTICRPAQHKTSHSTVYRPAQHLTPLYVDLPNIKHFTPLYVDLPNISLHCM